MSRDGTTNPETAVARAIAQCYRPETLAEWQTALATALEDSEDWEKYSDDDDDRRSDEQIALNQIVSMIARAQRMQEPNQ